MSKRITETKPKDPFENMRLVSAAERLLLAECEVGARANSFSDPATFKRIGWAVEFSEYVHASVGLSK